MKILNAVKVLARKPANDFVLVTMLTPFPCIMLAPSSNWVAVAVLAYTVLMGRVYGKQRWLDGFLEGQQEATKTHPNEGV